MKKASASLVVLSVIFLITAALLYLFEYVSIERMMYVNRSRARKFMCNVESIENIVKKDVKETYLSGKDISILKDKSYNIFEGQSAYLKINGPEYKDAFRIVYKEQMINQKEKVSERHYTLLNKIFFDSSPKISDKRKFYELIKSNNTENFTSDEINNYFLDYQDDEDKTFSFDEGLIVINANNSDLNCNIDGKGILIIDGDLNINGSLDFRGLIIINGKLSVKSNRNYIYGYIIDIEGGSNINYNKSLITIHNKCKNFKGIIDMRRYK